ncbi:MAG: glutathione S-transferase family protein [Pseudomonadota bacterium]
MYRIIGIESSPYAVKVRAVMRYRRLPYIWESRMPQFFEETKNVKPLIMPVVQFPNGDYRTDSTPIVLELETAHPGDRSILPSHPGLAFLCLLIEDLADEWLTKSLFYRRFSDDENAQYGAGWVMDDAHPQAAAEELTALINDFISRQRGRMPIVGCMKENEGALFDTHYRVLQALESFASTNQFLFGTRPSLADFALYGQLSTLNTDPAGLAIVRREAPRTERWVKKLDDASGIEGEWHEIGNLPGAVEELLSLAGEYYLPFLNANTQALEAGSETLKVELGGQSFTQPVYRYQYKCWDFLNKQYQGLETQAKELIEPILERSACLQHLRS